ncbi:hypothetical protein BX666DRAFT_1874207 [Dichotomocladium elegans]|nr:hypothetical protein BX666DRAFT_1874207 [Dichotomocladium elegans]
MSQSSEDGNIWGDTSSSFEDQLYNTAVIAEQRVVLSRQTRPATVGNTEARSTTNYANISLQKENMFHVYRDPQPNISTLRNLQMHAAPLGDLSNKSNNKRTSDSKIDGKEQGIKKKRTISAETSGFSSLLHSKDIAAPKQDHSADDEDDYMWMEFDVDLNALLESVEAKGAPSSTQFDTNPDPKEITEVHQQTVVDEQHSSEEEVNVHGVDHRHFESNLSKFGGFMTAGSKKALDANPEARKKALALFETTSDKHTNDDPDQNGVRAQFSQSLPPKSFGGFTTASGKNMTAPTKEALSKAELLFSKTDTLQPLRDVLSKESASGPTNHTKDINNGLTSFECQHGYDEISQRDMNQSMSGLEDDQVGFKYEDVLSRYGGFKTANSKGDFIVSAEAKRQAVALFNASESARDLTQSTQSQRVPCSPPRSEPSDSNSQQKHCQQPQLSSPQINNGDRDLCNPGCLNSPEMTPESKRQLLGPVCDGSQENMGQDHLNILNHL